MENSKLTPEQQEYLNLTPVQQEYMNDYIAWLDKRPEKEDVRFVFHSQLIIVVKENEDNIEVKTHVSNDINFVKPKHAMMIYKNLAEMAIRTGSESVLESIKDEKPL
jgi:hypothetical protein